MEAGFTNTLNFLTSTNFWKASIWKSDADSDLEKSQIQCVASTVHPGVKLMRKRALPYFTVSLRLALILSIAVLGKQVRKYNLKLKGSQTNESSFIRRHVAISIHNFLWAFATATHVACIPMLGQCCLTQRWDQSETQCWNVMCTGTALHEPT